MDQAVRLQAGLYFEAHVTTDPVFGADLERLKALAQAHRFRVAKLLMRKREGGLEEPHVDDSFCTARSTEWIDILNRTLLLVQDLGDAGFKVRRYKIEDTLLDIKP